MRKIRFTCSCGAFILVDETTEAIPASNGAELSGLIDSWVRGIWDGEIQAAMRPRSVVVLDIDAQHVVEMTSASDQQPIETFGPNRLDPALRHGVGLGRQDRRADDLRPFCAENVIEACSEFGVSVADEKARRLFSLIEEHDRVSRLLCHPGVVGMWSAAGDVNPATGQIDDEQDVENAAPTACRR